MAPPTLYYKDPINGDWVPFGTSDAVADEVQIASSAPSDTLTELWVDPAGTGTDQDWPQYDARYVSKTDPVQATMSVPLTLPGAPSNNLHAATKQYVDTTATMISSAAAAAHMPVGSIAMFAGKYLPPGWYPCDGSLHNSWALEQALDSVNSPLIPPSEHFGYIIYGGA